MARKRMSVRKIREILRLHYDGKLSNREVGASIGKSASVVHDCLKRFEASGLGWPLDAGLDDEGIERRLYAQPSQSVGKVYVQPDFEQVHRELARKHVTLYLVWQEYRAAHGEQAYQYSWFRDLYREWARPLGAVLRQQYKAGDKSLVDWSGDGVKIVDRETGEEWEAPLFVGVLGASCYTFAKAAASRESLHWLRLHCEMCEYFKGVTAAVVLDNEKTGVRSPSYYDPDLNPTYAAWAEHYDTAVLPTRPRKPRDKAKVESAVLIAQRWILARLRNHTFFTLEQANAAIAEQLEAFNATPMQKTRLTRRELYESIDKPALKPLPATRFEPFTWSSPTVGIDYHVVVEKHYYSAPYTLIGKRVEARCTGSTVELFYKGRRVATHSRSFVPWKHSTIDEHRPQKHREYLAWTPERLTNWAAKSGPKTAELVGAMMRAKRYPEQGYRACLGVLRLGKKHGDDRLEAACAKALALRSPRYHTVESILKNGTESQPLPDSFDAKRAQLTLPRHDNLRGADAYQ